MGRSDLSCVVGAYGEDFPHLRFSVDTPQGLRAAFDIEMECAGDYGNIQNSDGDYSRLREMEYKGLICIDYSQNGQYVKSVEKEAIKDFQLLDSHLKDIFNGLRVTTYMDENRYYEGESYRLRKAS